MTNSSPAPLPENAKSSARKESSKMPEIPREILASPLMKRGGFAVFNGLADEFIKSSLLAEAVIQQQLAVENNVSEPDAEEFRGGAPRRKFVSGAGGDFQQRFYRAQWMIDFLRELTTPLLRPTGDNGTYSYYLRTGDFLDIHRDILACDVAVITCLKNRRGESADGGNLCLYPTRISEPLSAVRRTPERGGVKIMLAESQTVVMYGGLIPHALLPLGAGQQRIVSVLCYSAL